MNMIELIDNRNQKVKELEVFTDAIKLEKREMNDEENDNFLLIRSEVENFNKQINNIKTADKKEVRNVVDKKNNEIIMNEKFSLLKAIREIAYNKASEVT